MKKCWGTKVNTKRPAKSKQKKVNTKRPAKSKQKWICPELGECSDCDHQFIHKKIRNTRREHVACDLDLRWRAGRWECPKCVLIESIEGARAVAAKVFNIPMGEKKDE